MKPLEFEDGTIQVDAEIVAAGLGISAEDFLDSLREGRITSLCEQGVDEDAGRYRLTFYSGSCRFRLVAEENGKIIQRSTVDFGERPLPISARKAGGRRVHIKRK